MVTPLRNSFVAPISRRVTLLTRLLVMISSKAACSWLKRVRGLLMRFCEKVVPITVSNEPLASRLAPRWQLPAVPEYATRADLQASIAMPQRGPAAGVAAHWIGPRTAGSRRIQWRRERVPAAGTGGCSSGYSSPAHLCGRIVLEGKPAYSIVVERVSNISPQSNSLRPVRGIRPPWPASVNHLDASTLSREFA